jgi:hypothetical protein
MHYIFVRFIATLSKSPIATSSASCTGASTVDGIALKILLISNCSSPAILQVLVLSDARAPVQEFHISFISFIVVPILWKL